MEFPLACNSLPITHLNTLLCTLWHQRLQLDVMMAWVCSSLAPWCIKSSHFANTFFIGPLHPRVISFRFRHPLLSPALHVTNIQISKVSRCAALFISPKFCVLSDHVRKTRRKGTFASPHEPFFVLTKLMGYEEEKSVGVSD